MDVKEYLVDENATMLEAMAQLDKIAKKVLFVVSEGAFVGAITDGDIRRWILKKGNLEAKVKDIANYEPKYLKEHEKLDAKSYMRQHTIDALPIVNDNNDIIDVVLWSNNLSQPKISINIPVVVMAGGFGSRLYPYTKILPKPLIPIGDIPIVEHIMNRFHQQGCEKFYLIVHHKKNMIKAYFNEIIASYSVEFVDEEKPLGTGGGLGLLKNSIDSTFILTNCDVLIDENYEKIYNYHKKEKNLITMVCSLKVVKIPYGVIEINELGAIESMKEKPELSFFTNTGMYFVEPRVIAELKVDETIGFPDIIENYIKSGEKVGVFPISESSWLDMGQFDEMEEMKKRLENNE